MILGIDAGNNEVKVATDKGVFKFNSCIGEWRERRLNTITDWEIEYMGKKCFAGDLAEDESQMKRITFGTTKAHEETKLRVLLAVYLYGDKFNDIVIGQPIISHTESEKQSIKAMLLGEKELTVNGASKRFYIDSVTVSPEGAIGLWSMPQPKEYVKFIDVGSGTINLGSIKKYRFNDKESHTLDFGAESTKTKDIKALAESIKAFITNTWNKDDEIYLIGGAAEVVAKELNMKVHYPIHNDKEQHPIFTNAIGFYNVGRVTYARQGNQKC
jgi:plasmid segregation protein ParM